VTQLTEHTLNVGPLAWFYREGKTTADSDKLPVVLLHGLPSQSHSWTVIMPELVQQGYRAIAPDWIGCGASSKPDQRDFAYTPDAFVTALGDFLQALQIEKFYLVVQGFLGSVGLQYALRNPQQIEKLIILNAPITTEAKLPWQIQQLGLPFIGDMLTQDPLFVDRTLEKGSKYTVGDDDLDIYRRPYLKTSAAGRSTLAIIKKLQLNQVTTEIEAGFASWQIPTLLIWGMIDPWLDFSQAEKFTSICQNTKLVKLAEAGHYAQEHWSNQIAEEMLLFMRQQTSL
jgi:pimeloyl-ACP methyl ester carboxylesterase